MYDSLLEKKTRRTLRFGFSYSQRRSASNVVLLALMVASGCKTQATQIFHARNSFYNGNLSVANQKLEKAIGRGDEKNDFILADQAIVDLVSGDAAIAEQKLRRVRDSFDHLEQAHLGESALTLIADDRSRAYAGEDYEKVLVRNFLAISNLMHDGSDAIPYCLQANQEQNRILNRAEEKQKKNKTDDQRKESSRVALSAYLYGTLKEQTHRSYDDAQRAYTAVAAWSPDFHAIKSDIQRVQYGSHSQPGNGVVHVIALVGPGPVKQETVAPVTSDALMIASQILGSVGDRQFPKFSAPVKIPEVVVPQTNVHAIQIHAGNQFLGSTSTITDVGQLATTQHEIARNRIIARAVVRRLVKKGAIYEAKDELAEDSSWASIAFDAAEFAWEASEQADTRCWGLLPGTIQVARIELPQGTHELTLAAARENIIIGDREATRVRVENGRNTYVLAYFPDNQLVGKIVVSANGRLK